MGKYKFNDKENEKVKKLSSFLNIFSKPTIAKMIGIIVNGIIKKIPMNICPCMLVLIENI